MFNGVITLRKKPQHTMTTPSPSILIPSISTAVEPVRRLQIGAEPLSDGGVPLPRLRARGAHEPRRCRATRRTRRGEGGVG